MSSISGLKDSQDAEKYLRKAYDLITNQYEAGKLNTITRLFDLYSSSVDDLWNRSGFLHCTNQNYLLTLLLVKSGLFLQDDITPKWTFIWHVSPHQYLSIKIQDKSFNVDCWARHYGIEFGSYAKGFNSTARKSFANHS